MYMGEDISKWCIYYCKGAGILPLWRISSYPVCHLDGRSEGQPVGGVIFI